MDEINSDYDSAWKEALTEYFEQFMELCFSQAYQEIDWLRGYETLDSELQEIIAEAQIGRRLADKLVKVWLNNGEETFVLVHIEVQGQTEAEFPKRMYIYNHRIFDRYDKEVISLAVLGDEQKNWRPNNYGYSRWGFSSSLVFPTIKLLDFAQQIDILETSSNPFATIILAHLQAQATRGNFPERKQYKFSLVRRLYERGYTGENIRQLFRFIEWIMALPPALQQEFKTELKRYEEEKKMPFITSFERDGIEIGLKQGLEQGLQQGLEQGQLQNCRENILEILLTRFEQVPDSVTDKLTQMADFSILKQLHKKSITIASVADFEQLIDTGTTSTN